MYEMCLENVPPITSKLQSHIDCSPHCDQTPTPFTIYLQVFRLPITHRIVASGVMPTYFIVYRILGATATSSICVFHFIVVWHLNYHNDASCAETPTWSFQCMRLPQFHVVHKCDDLGFLHGLGWQRPAMW